MRSRLENWPELLDAYVRQHEHTPFAWGTHDCCTFAANWVLMITDHDPMAVWRGQYRTATGARRLIDGAGGLEPLLIGALGQPIAAGFAQRGDVILREMSLGPTVGIVLLGGAAFPGLDGIERRLIPVDAKVWRV